MAYDWYRSSASTVPSKLHPVMRVLLDADGDLTTITDRGGLVFELAYNGGGPTVTTDAWVTRPIGASSILWGFEAFPTIYSKSLADWKADPAYSSAVILGFSLGVGSGWDGDFKGAVDNPTWFLDGPPTSTNFEVVPEPTTWAAFAGLGLLGFALWRRHGRSKS